MWHVEPTWSTSLGDGRIAHVIATDRSHGNLAINQERDVVEPRRTSLVDARWCWLNQVHGAQVKVVESAGGVTGDAADGLSTAVTNAPIAVQVADCAPVALVGHSGVVAVVHAGWRGLLEGVIASAVQVMRHQRAGEIVAVLGPCIHPQSYEFGSADLSRVEEALGPSVRSATAEGLPALDVPAAVASALQRDGIPLVATLGGCTATESGRYWSHRARGDTERQAMVVWVGDSAEPEERAGHEH